MVKSRIWSQSEWRRKRSEFIENKVCKWCGSKSSLVIHHTKSPLRFKQVVSRVRRRFLRQKIKDGEFKGQMKRLRLCPHCRKRSFYRRTTMKPPYRCSLCGYEFEEPEEVRIRTNWLSKKDWRRFMRKYGSEINERAAELPTRGHEYYMSLKDCIALCKKCHFALHKGLVLCRTCKKKYHLKQHSSCWNCIPDSKWKREIERAHREIDVILPSGPNTKHVH